MQQCETTTTHYTYLALSRSLFRFCNTTFLAAVYCNIFRLRYACFLFLIRLSYVIIKLS